MKGIAPRRKKAKEMISRFEDQLRTVERLRKDRFGEGERLCEAIEHIHKERMHSEDLAPLVEALHRVCQFFSVAGGVDSDSPMRAVRAAAERIGVKLAAKAGKEEALEKIRAARPIVFAEKKRRPKRQATAGEGYQARATTTRERTADATCRATGAFARCVTDKGSVRCLAKGDGASCETKAKA